MLARHRRRAIPRADPPQHRILCRDVTVIGAAATTHEVHTKFADETLHPHRHILGGQRVMRLAIHQFRQAGIGLHRNQPRPVLAQPADMLLHLLRPGGAVQPQQRHVQCMDNGGRRSDIGADQQRAGGLHRHLHENRNAAAGFTDRRLGGIHRRLDEQRILIRLGQDRVHAGIDQATALLRQRRFQIVIFDMAERGQLRPRPDIADHIAVPAIGKTLRRLARQFHRAAIDLIGLRRQVELAQRDGRTAKGVGQHHIRAGLEIAAMNLAHEIRPREIQNLGAILIIPVILLDIEIGSLNPAAHAAVTQQNLGGKGFEKMRTGG